MSAPEPMTEERLKEIEAKIAKIETSRTLAGIQIMTGDPAAVVRDDVPALVAEVRRLRGEVAIWTKTELDRIDARLRYVADKTDFRLTCELSAEERALLAERVALLYEKATIVKTGRPASWVEPKPDGT